MKEFKGYFNEDDDLETYGEFDVKLNFGCSLLFLGFGFVILVGIFYILAPFFS